MYVQVNANLPHIWRVLRVYGLSLRMSLYMLRPENEMMVGTEVKRFSAMP